MSDSAITNSITTNQNPPSETPVLEGKIFTPLPTSAKGLVFSRIQAGERTWWRIVETLVGEVATVTVIQMNTTKYVLEDIPLTQFVEMMKNGELRREDDPWPKKFIGQKPSDAAILIQKKRNSRIENLIRLKFWRFRRTDLIEEIKQAAKNANCSQRTIENDLRDYLQNGQTPLALRPLLFLRGKSGKRIPKPGAKKRGRRSKVTKAKIKEAEAKGESIDPEQFVTGTNLTPEIERKFKRGYEIFVGSGLTDKDDATFDMILTYFFGNTPDNIEDLKLQKGIPTIDSYKKWRQENVDPVTQIVNLVGEREYKKNFAPKLGNSTEMVEHAYEAWMTDVKKIRCRIYCDLAPELVVTSLSFCPYVDQFSHYIHGYYLGPEYESQIIYFLAFQNATRNGYVPNGIFGDRGPLKGTRVEPPMNDLSVAILDAPPGRPDLKGLIESLLKKIVDLAFSLYQLNPVHVTSGDADHTLNVALSYTQLIKLIELAIRLHNETMYMDNYPTSSDMDRDMVDKTPEEILKWSLENYGEPNWRDPEHIKSIALVPGVGSIGEDGLKFLENGKLYYAPELVPIIQKLAKSKTNSRTKSKKRKRVDLRFDPRHGNSVWIIVDEKRVECKLIENRDNEKFKDRNLAEFALYDLHEALLKDRNADARLLNKLQIKLEGLSVAVGQSPEIKEILKERGITIKQLNNLLNRVKNISVPQQQGNDDDEQQFDCDIRSADDQASSFEEDPEPDYTHLMRANRNLLDDEED